MLLNSHYSMWIPINRSGNRRLQREKQELKAPQERSDEEIEALPAERVRLERRLIVLWILLFYPPQTFYSYANNSHMGRIQISF